jgi:hypothetical protein
MYPAPPFPGFGTAEPSKRRVARAMWTILQMEEAYLQQTVFNPDDSNAQLQVAKDV